MNTLFPQNQKIQKRIKKRINLIKWSPLVKMLSWILIFALLNVSGGCMNYFKVSQTLDANKGQIESFYNHDKKLIVHLDDQAWILEVPEVIDEQLVAFAKKKYVTNLTKPVNPNKRNRFILKEPYNQSTVLNEVHIYTSEFSRLNDDKISFPVSSIKKIDVYEFDKGATSSSAVMGAIGGSFLVWGGLFLILLLTSCPFIYSNDGSNYQLAGEIYSGSVQKQLERDDFLKLPNYKLNDPDYTLKITNELKEIQHTNLLELWVFDHARDSKIAVDKYGKSYQLSNIITPNSAKNLTGIDVTELIKEIDGLVYTSSKLNEELALTDGVVLEFSNPKTAENAKLLVAAKNTIVMDYMIGQFYNQFGDLYDKWTKKQKTVPAEQLRQWMLDQNIPLSVSLERNGKWESVDYFNIAGPVAMKEDLLTIPLNGSESDPLKIKLESGYFFWEIDFAGIDFTENSEVNYQIISANSAITQERKDVSKKLVSDDNKYYTQPNSSDQAIVKFLLPELSNEARTLFLHSKGWYQILRNPSGTPDREYLETFRQPGRFNEFVNDYLQNLTENKIQ